MILFGFSISELLEVLLAVLTLSAPFAKLTGPDHPTGKRFRMTQGQMVLVIFGSFVLGFAWFTARMYWSVIADKKDTIIYGLWLFLFMVLGMFAQVMVSNYHKRKRLFDVSADQLILPLFLSVTTFYVIWVATNTPGATGNPVSPFHTAFLNGYFWKTMGGPRDPQAPAEEI